MEYLEDHGLRRVSKRLAHSGVLDVVSTAIPGIRDVLVLGKVKQLERDGAADLILVDAPATGHAITFLTSASGLVGAARGGPLRTQAQDVVDLLSDPARCRVILVTLPEELPVSETIESAYTLEDKAGVQLGPVIVNACDPEPVGLERPAAEVAAAAGVTVAPDAPGRARGGPATSGWPATPSRPSRSSACAGTCPCPTSSCRPSTRPPSGRPRPRCWPTRWPTRWRRWWPRGRRERRRPRRRSHGAAAAASAGAGDAGRAGGRALGRGVLRVGRRRQDDGVGHLRPGGGPGRPALLRGHRRPGAAAGRRAGRGVAAQHALGGGGRLARPPARADARLEGHVRRPGPALRPHAGAGRVDPGQPALPESRRRAVGHAGVHGHGEALRAGPVRRVRHRGRRHARRRATRSTCSTRRAA